MDLLKGYGGALLGLGFIYFVVLRFIKTDNKKKAFIALGMGVVITFILYLCKLNDEKRLDIVKIPYSFTDPYFCFFNTSIIYTIVLPIILFFTGKSRRSEFNKYAYKIKKEQEKKVKPTIKDVNEYVYYCFKENGDYILFEKSDKFGGKVKSLSGKIIFQDELIKEIVKDYDYENYNLVGEITVHNKRDDHYYCYLIDLNNTDGIEEFKRVSPYELINYEMDDFNKQILFHMVMKEYFKVEMEGDK